MKLFVLGWLLGFLHSFSLFAGVRPDQVNGLVVVTEFFVYLQLGTMICSLCCQLRISNGGGIRPLLWSVVSGAMVGTCVAILSAIAFWVVMEFSERNVFFRIPALAATSIVPFCWAFSFLAVGILTTPGGTKKARSSLHSDYDDRNE
jgi:hypothetical protein